MGSLLGGRGMPCGGGWWVSGQLALVGGERERGAGAPQILITCPGSQGTVCPCSLFMIRVGRPWNPLLLLMGPGSFSLMHSARSNKSSSEGDRDTLCAQFRRNFFNSYKGTVALPETFPLL